MRSFSGLLLALGSTGCPDPSAVEVGESEKGSGSTGRATDTGMDDTGVSTGSTTDTETGDAEGSTGSDGSAMDTSTEGSTGGTGATTDTNTGDDEEPICGNGIAEAGEACDDEGESALCDVDCTVAGCGDGVFNATAGEDCEGDDLAGGTCEGLGFDVGTLACEADCFYDVSECYALPDEPVLQLDFSQVKRFDFGWAAVAEAEYYQLLESPAPGEPFGQIGGDIIGESVSFEMPLHFRFEASYLLRACNGGGCTDSAVVDVMGSLEQAVGYVKASNTGAVDQFGINVALSGDGNTLAVSAFTEDSNATGIGGNQADDSVSNSGAVYVFVRDGAGAWSQQAYVKASNTGVSDWFGIDVALSGDGNTLVVSAHGEDSNATGIGGNQADDSASGSGAVYVFVRDGAGAWSQQTYIKASNTGAIDNFHCVALSGDGNTLAVGASWEDSNATGIGGNQADNSTGDSGAVYVFVRDGAGAWSQQAYVKASNTGAGDHFGDGVALSGDGNTLAVGADSEDSNATGTGGNQADNSAGDSGAVYVFVRDGAGAWSQQAYVKASNAGALDLFGIDVALSGDGSTLAVGAYGEDSNATGIGGNQVDNSASGSGAVYVFVRDGAGAWSQQTYIKASNTGAGDWFGWSVALSGDGNALAVGAYGEDSNATGIEGNQADNSALYSGAVYVFVRDGAGVWSQQAYAKAANTGASDYFGESVALSGDGNTLAVGTPGEDSNATGIGGDQTDDSAGESGAVYLY